MCCAQGTSLQQVAADTGHVTGNIISDQLTNGTAPEVSAQFHIPAKQDYESWLNCWTDRMWPQGMATWQGQAGRKPGRRIALFKLWVRRTYVTTMQMSFRFPLGLFYFCLQCNWFILLQLDCHKMAILFDSDCIGTSKQCTVLWQTSISVTSIVTWLT